MNELRRSADRVIEELRKTDPIKATECSSHVERLQVLRPVESMWLYTALFSAGSHLYKLLSCKLQYICSFTSVILSAWQSRILAHYYYSCSITAIQDIC